MVKAIQFLEIHMLPTFDALQAAQKKGLTVDKVLADPAYDLEINRDREGLALAWAIVADDRAGFVQALRALATSERLKVEKTPAIELSSALGYAYHPSRLQYVVPLAQRLLETKNGKALLREDLILAVRQGEWRRFNLLLPSVGSDREDLHAVMKAVLAHPEAWDREGTLNRMNMLHHLLLPVWARWVRDLKPQDQSDRLQPLIQASARHPELMDLALHTFADSVQVPQAACLLALSSDDNSFQNTHRHRLAPCLESIRRAEVNDCRQLLVYQWGLATRRPKVKALLDMLESSRAATHTPIPDSLKARAQEMGCPLGADEPSKPRKRCGLGSRA